MYLFRLTSYEGYKSISFDDELEESFEILKINSIFSFDDESEIIDNEIDEEYTCEDYS